MKPNKHQADRGRWKLGSLEYLLGRLELDKINGKRKLDYFKNKFMDKKPHKEDSK